MKRKVAKLKLSPNEEARIIREELDRRRKLRIQQVREQQRCIALHIRQEVEQRRQRELKQLEEELREDWERQQREKLHSLQRLYQESLQLLGQGHRSAKENEPDLAAIAQREEENHVKAEERYRDALKELKSQRLKDHERQSRSVNARKKALQAEKERSAKVASLPLPLPNPIQSIDTKRLHVVKKSDVSAFAATHYHMPESTVDREADTEQPNAHQGAELEVRRLQDLQREEERRREEQLEKARLRGKQALRREHLVQDRERLLVELEHMQQTDLLRRRQQVSQMPAQIFQPLYKRQETREEFQREMEFAFEDMYTGERRVKGDLVVQLVPEPLPALSSGSQDQELDVTLDEIYPQAQHETEQEAGSTEQETSAQAEPSRPAPRRALKKLLDRIRSQRNQWTNSHVPAADLPSTITDQIPERDTTIDTGSLTSEEKDNNLSEPARSPPGPAADTQLPDVFAKRVQEFEEERKKREEELEREKQQQVVLLQELEEQKAKLEQMLLEAQQEREDLKAVVTQQRVSVNQSEVPVHDQEVTTVTPGEAAELVPPAGEDGHNRRIREYQQRLLEQNRIHQRSVEVARQRLEEYQRALQIRYNMTTSSPPVVVPPVLIPPPLHSAPSVHLLAPLQLPTTPAVHAFTPATSQTPMEVLTRESDRLASPSQLPASAGLKLLPDNSISNSPKNQRRDAAAWLTDNIMERVTEHLPERVRPPSEPLSYKLFTTNIPLQPTSDPIEAVLPSIRDGAALISGHAAVRPGTLLHGSMRTGCLSPREDDDMERQRRELQEVQRQMLEQREAVALQQEEERQRRELQEVQRQMLEQREAVALQQEEERQRVEQQEVQRLEQQRQREDERRRQELQEGQRRVLEQREAVALQKEEERQKVELQEVQRLEQLRQQEDERRRQGLQEVQRRVLEQREAVALQKEGERQRKELQEVQRRMLEQREAVTLLKEEERQRKELQEVQRLEQLRQQEEERRRQELQEGQRRMLEQREAVALQKEEERQRKELQEVQRRMLEQREAVALQQRQQEEERQRQEGEMERMRQQKEMLQALIHTDAEPVPEAESEEPVSVNISQTRLTLLASLLRAIEESNGGTLSHLEDPQERDGSPPQPAANSSERDLISQSNGPAGPAPASVLLSGHLPPPRAAKPPLTRVRPGIMEMMTEQHELSAIQEVETPVNSSGITGPEDGEKVPAHTQDWDLQEDPESSVASDTTLQTPSWSSSVQPTADRLSGSGTGSRRSSQFVWRERLLMGAGTSPESSESDSVLRIISPLSSDSGRGADYSGPAVTSCRSPTESALRPPDSDCLSSTTISTGSYITTDPEQNVNPDNSQPLRLCVEQDFLDVSSPSGQSFCTQDSPAAGRPAPAVESLFNDSSIQHIIDRYTRELNISLSTAGKTTDSEGSYVEDPGFSVSQQSLVRLSDDESSAAQRTGPELDDTVCQHVSGEGPSLAEDSFRPLLGQLADQSSCLALDQRDSSMEQLVGQPSAHSSMIAQHPGLLGGWDSTLSRMIGRLSHQSDSHWLSGGQDFYAGQLMGQAPAEQSSTWLDLESQMRPLVGELDESAGQHSGSSDERTHLDLGVSTETSGPSHPALPAEASPHGASVPGQNPLLQDQTLQSQTSPEDPDRTEVFPGSDSFHPLLAEVTHNETADPSMIFHLPEHLVPSSPERQPASGECSVSTPSAGSETHSVESEPSPERFRAEQLSSCRLITSQCFPHGSVLMVSPTMRTEVELAALSLSNLTTCEDAAAVNLQQPERTDSDRSCFSDQHGGSVPSKAEQVSHFRSALPLFDKITEAASETGILEQSEITLVSLTDTTLQDQETTVTEEDKHPDGGGEEGQKSQDTEGSESACSMDETPEEKKQTPTDSAMLLEFQWGPCRDLQEAQQQRRTALLQRSARRVEEVKARGALAKIQPEIRAPPEAAEQPKTKESHPDTKLEPQQKTNTKSKGGQAKPLQTTEKSAIMKQRKPQRPPPVSLSGLKTVHEVKSCTPEQRKQDVSEMHRRTQRLYEQLEEVKNQKAVRSRQEDYAKNRLKAKEFHQKTLQKLRAKQTLK